MRLQDYPTEPRYTATVKSSEAITEEGSEVEVRELVMSVDEHEFNFGYAKPRRRGGQHTRDPNRARSAGSAIISRSGARV